MDTGRILCIAGKNNIAAQAIVYSVAHYGASNVVFLPSESDGQKPLWQDSASDVAVKLGIQIVSDIEDLYSMHNLVFVSLEFDKIINPILFKSNRLFNVHFSKLPKYRGVYTSFLPIFHGEKESGVTLHLIENGIDSGPIIEQINFKLPSGIRAFELYDLYTRHAFEIFKNNLHVLVSDNPIASYIQNEQDATYFSRKMVRFTTTEINLNQSSFTLINWIRAMTFPAFQYPTFHGKKIMYSEICPRQTIKTGQFVEISNSAFLVGTHDFDLLLILI